MAGPPTRRSLLALLGSVLASGCAGRDGKGSPSTSDDPSPTDRAPSATTEHTPPPTDHRTPSPTDVTDLFVGNDAGRAVTVTVTATPASGETFSATLTLAADEHREFDTVAPLDENGTLTVAVESREETATYELPVQGTLVVAVTEDGVRFGRLLP
jgi:hypothetical protein